MDTPSFSSAMEKTDPVIMSRKIIAEVTKDFVIDPFICFISFLLITGLTSSVRHALRSRLHVLVGHPL